MSARKWSNAAVRDAAHAIYCARPLRSMDDFNRAAASVLASPAVLAHLAALIEAARCEGYALARDVALDALAPSDGAIYTADHKAQMAAHYARERVAAKLDEVAELRGLTPENRHES